MDNGITAAQQFNLQPGIALTSAQMAALTSDIVWLVQKEVTLADGSKQKVLAPQVYARLKEGDIDGSGALLSGNTLDLNLSGDLVNSGTLAGRSVVALTADNLQNLNGRISGGDVQVAARTDLANLGGIIDAQTRLNVSAGRDLTVASTTARNQNAQGSITHLDRIAGLYVADGSLAASAGRDLTLTAAQVVNSGTQSGEAGQTTLVAGRDLNLNTVTTASQNNLAWNANNWRKDASSQEIGAAIQSQGNIQLAAGNDLNARAASVTSDQGALKVTALNNVTISAGQSTQFVDEKHQSTSKGFLSSKTISTRDTLDQTQAQASTFSGQTVTVQAGNDLTVRGSNVVGTGDVSLLAGNNVTIDAATNRFSQTHLKDVKQSGLLSANGGIGFTIGTRQQTDTTQSQGTTQSQSRSLIGSTDGSLTISAGKDATIRGS
ncbi:Haemagluttinin repeat-containing protein, partial [Formivibrio citricus]